MSSNYVLIDKETRHIKLDEKTGMLCIFDDFEKAKMVKSRYQSDSEVSVLECEVSFSKKREFKD